jgi:hypothetical protein
MNVALRNSKGKLVRSRPARYRPLVETLEARTVPSVSFKPTGIAGVGSFAGASAPSAPLAGFNVNTDTVDTISNETSLAVNPTNTNNIVGSANDYQIDPVTGAETILSNAHVSFDGGATWTIYSIPSRGYSATGDPAIAFDATGRAYAAFLGDYINRSTYPDVWATTSTDGGKTWRGSEILARNTSRPDGSGVFNDKEYIAAWGNGNAIVTWTNFNLGSGGSYISSPIFDSVTHDGGQSWSAPQQISGPNIFDQGSVPTVAADGSIHVTFFSGDAATAPNFRDSEYVIKVDPTTGAALTTPVNVGLIYDGVNDNPYNADGRTTLQDSQFRVSLPQGNITADPTNALHLAVDWFDTRNGLATSSNPYATTTNSDIIVSQSFDGGATWSSPQALAIANDQFMPWAAYDGTGHLQIGYFDRSYDAANHLYGYTLASETTPGSLTFTTQQVTTALSDPVRNDAWFRRNVNPSYHNATGFIGDYSNIAILGNGGVGAFWTDLREPTNFPGRVGLHSEDAYFGDPVTGSSSNLLVGAVSPSHGKPATIHTDGHTLDNFFGGLANAANFGLTSKSSTSNSNSTLSAGLLAHLADRLGFDWLDDSAENPLA